MYAAQRCRALAGLATGRSELGTHEPQLSGRLAAPVLRIVCTRLDAARRTR
jgi:hypothetical protein